MFGLPTHPGCLAEAVRGLAARQQRTASRHNSAASPSRSPVKVPHPTLPRPKVPTVHAPSLPAVPKLPKLPKLPPPVQHAVDGVTGAVGGQAQPPDPQDQANNVLGYLLGP